MKNERATAVKSQNSEKSDGCQPQILRHFLRKCPYAKIVSRFGGFFYWVYNIFDRFLVSTRILPLNGCICNKFPLTKKTLYFRRCMLHSSTASGPSRPWNLRHTSRWHVELRKFVYWKWELCGHPILVYLSFWVWDWLPFTWSSGYAFGVCFATSCRLWYTIFGLLRYVSKMLRKETRVLGCSAKLVSD